MTFTAARVAVGRLFELVGVLLLLFVPYALWGTDLIAAQNQTTLRNDFEAAQHQLARAHAPTTPRTSTPGAGTSGGTPPAPVVAPSRGDPPLKSAVGLISIPSIGLSMAIVEGTGEAQLQMGPGHYPGTPLPGQSGNVAIAGHRTTYLRPFYSLDALHPGDSILITTLQGTFTYRVTGSETVLPSDVSVIAPSTTPELTLTTCTPRYSASHRLVVRARLAASVLAHGSTGVPPPRPATMPPTSGLPGASKRPKPAALTAPTGSWVPTLLWGAGVLALAIAVLWGARRSRGGRRVAVMTVGSLAWLLVVFFFFGAVTPLLPASF